MKSIIVLIAVFFFYTTLAFSQSSGVFNTYNWLTKGADYGGTGSSGAKIEFKGGYLSGSYTIGGDLTLTPGAGYADGKIKFHSPTTGTVAEIDGSTLYINSITKMSFPRTSYLSFSATASSNTSLNVLGKLVASDVNLTGGNSFFKSGTTPLVDIKTTGTEIHNPLRINSDVKIVNNNAADRFIWQRIDGSNKTGFKSDGYSSLMVLTNNEQRMAINSTGQIGIGKEPVVGIALDVAGIIRSTEMAVQVASISSLNVEGSLQASDIRVSAKGQTADFVFESDYQLRPLEEVESFILENKHLPEIPSAEQMETDGVNLAEMNKLLLMKVEELTLYVIQQQKLINSLIETRK